MLSGIICGHCSWTRRGGFDGSATDVWLSWIKQMHQYCLTRMWCTPNHDLFVGKGIHSLMGSPHACNMVVGRYYSSRVLYIV